MADEAVDEQEHEQCPGEPKKRSKLFPFLRRRKDKGKSKSLTDLSLKEEGRRSGSRERANRSFRLPGRQPTFDAQDLSVDKRNSAADSPRSSIGDRGSDVEKDPIIIDDDNESDRKESSEEEDSETENGENEQLETTSETVPEWPPGTTASMVWKSGYSSFFAFDVEIKEGLNLIARDRSGTSDPYVKVKLRGKCVHKTKVIFKNLNPAWNERFNLALDNVNTNMLFKVYDFDRIGSDDHMGVASVNIGELEVNKSHELTLDLINRNGFQEDLGQIKISVLIVPKASNERVQAVQLDENPTVTVEEVSIKEPTDGELIDEEPTDEELIDEETRRIIENEDWRHNIQEFTKYLSQRNNTKRGSRGQLWDAVLSVTLVEGKKLRICDDNGFSDPYCKFKLGNEKYRSKHCKATLNPQWKERFEMKIYPDSPTLLEIVVWDKDPGRDEFMGRCSIDLNSLEKEQTHYLEAELEDKAGFVCLYLTVTALCASGSESDLDTVHRETDSKRNEQVQQYSLIKTFKAVDEIGWLQLKIHRANQLAVADLGGASDPFAVIEVNNQRVITPTIYKTLNPVWEKHYEMSIYDIHEVIDITILDEDRRGAPEFLGRVNIPLLSIIPQEKRIYRLKDKHLERPVKGFLVITLDVIFNPVRASIRTFNPREPNALHEPPRFRRQLLQQNVDRLSNLIRSLVATGQFIQSLFTWKYKLRSAFAFTLYILLVLHFDWYILPLVLLLVLMKNYTVFVLSADRQHHSSDEGEATSTYEDDDDEDDQDNNKKIHNRPSKNKSLREKLEAVTNICTTVQNQLDFLASIGERIKNTFNWSVPFCSYLLMVILTLGTIVLYFIPLRYIMLAWGINKFTKKIRKPNAVGNNELLDFLSRIPSDPQLKQRRLLKEDTALR